MNENEDVSPYTETLNDGFKAIAWAILFVVLFGVSAGIGYGLLVRYAL